MSAMEYAEPAPKFQGSLEKQGRVAKTWKKYWFLLKDNELTYMKNPEKLLNSAQINMSDVHTVRSTTGKNGYPFEIVTKSKTHYLSAPTAELRDKWIKVLHDSMTWCSRHASTASSAARHSSNNSSVSRASCHSISDSDCNVSTSSSVLTTHRSSGYGSTASGLSDVSVERRRRSPSLGADSGTEDMCTKSNMNSAQSNGYASGSQPRHEELRRVAVQSSVPDLFVPVQSSTSGDYDSVFLPDGVRLSQIDQGYANVARKGKDSCGCAAADSHHSGHKSADLAISHIMQGYANIKRKPGPNSSVPEDCAEDDDVHAADDDGDDESRGSPCSVRRRDGHPEEEDSGDKPSAASSTSPDHCSDVPRSMFTLTSFPPIRDLLHPRLELTHRTSFDDIRNFLASNRGPDVYYSPVNRSELDGRHVRALKDYLAARCY